MEMLEKIQEILLKNKFKQESDEIYTWEKEIQLPDSQIVINGQRTVQPGPKIIRSVTVEFFGQGAILGDDSEDRFEEIHFKVEDLEQNRRVGNIQEVIEGFYPEDLDRVEEIIKQLIS